MMEMKEQTGSRKKLLVPVVVLMLCLVTLTGAAYAYSSTMTYTNNTVQEDFISIDLATPNPATDVTVGNVTAIAFTDDFVYDANNAKTDTVKAYITQTEIVYNLKIKGDVACNAVKISSSNIATFLAKPIGNETILSDLIGVEVRVNSSATGESLTTNGAQVTLNLAGDDAKTAEETAQAVTIHVVFTVAAASNPYTIVNGGNCTVTAETCYNALKTANFDLKFAVEPQAA